MSKILSLVIPAYNEERTIAKLLEMVLELDLPQSYRKEIIIINDCSVDNTLPIIKEYSSQYKNISYIDNKKNLGKTQSVKKGLLKTTGDYVVIQDADLEYDPIDIVKMLNYAIEEECDVVYGDRFRGHNGLLYLTFFVGNKGVSFISNLFTYPRTRKWIPDMEVCYKLVRGDVVRDIAKNISAISSFGLEPELTARLSRYGKLKWGVIPVKYYPRSIQEGKKIRYSDGIKAVREIVRYNIGKGK